MEVYVYCIFVANPKVNMMKVIVITLCLLFSGSSLDAQIFGRLLDKAVDRVVEKTEDRLVEAIANKLYRSIDQTVDSMLYQTYNEGGADSVDYATFLKGMDASSRLPDKYNFDVVLDVEIIDGKDVNKMRMLMSTDGQFFGFEQYEEKDSPIMVIDTEHDLIAMYQHEDDGRSVIAMPNMMKRYAVNAVDARLSDDNYTFEKTGKTRMIHGYQCDEYRFETDKDKGTGYAASDFPVSWSDAFGASLGQLTSKQTTVTSEYLEGMLLMSTAVSKKSGKTSTWEVVDVDLTGEVIDNATYSKTAIGQAD